MTMSRSGVVVVGSITADVTAFADRLPQPGETVLGKDFTLVLGGKGANQAVAAAHFGAPTWLVGRVGDDPFADLTRDSLAGHGVHNDWVRQVPGPTGVAHIRVDSSGQNDIVITPLANARLDESMVDEALAELAPHASVLLLQLEIRAEITAYAAAAGREAGLQVVLDPAPAAELPAALWRDIDIVTPNESETAAITGLDVTDHASAARAARWFLDRGVGQAIITLGDKGAVSVDARGTTTFAAFGVPVVDTTAAGDAFTGTLGAGIALGQTTTEAIRLAMAAGALAVTKPGASPSLPGRNEITALAGQTGKVA